MAEGRQHQAVPCVWIVDDDEAIRTALARLVRTIGYHAAAHASGEALLAAIAAGELSIGGRVCVLTDIQMPGMSGLELAAELRRLRRDLSIALMTAYPSLASRALARQGSGFEYMTKPIDDLQLEAWLARVVGDPPRE